MSEYIDFGVWAPSEAVFWQTWIDAGICTAPHVFAAAYAGIQTNAATWPGIVETAEGEPVPGWHTNVRVAGPLVAAFTAGRPATGTVWERTNAAAVFGLTSQPADPDTGFPAGMRSSSGVTYCDPSAFASPSNVWA
jgi:hypothetical protein